MNKLSLQELKSRIESENPYCDFDTATLLPYGNYITLVALAPRPKSITSQYRYYYNMYGERVAELTTRNGDWYNLARQKRTANILTTDLEEYSRIKEWLMDSDPSITRVKLR